MPCMNDWVTGSSVKSKQRYETRYRNYKVIQTRELDGNDVTIEVINPDKEIIFRKNITHIHSTGQIHCFIDQIIENGGKIPNE